MATYPTGIKIYIDDVDVTAWLFGTDTINPSESQYRWNDIDISGYIIDKPGDHKLTVTCEDGIGRVEARLEIR